MPKRITLRRSPIHGNGVFAVTDIPKGTELLEYRGRLMTHAQIDRKYASVPDNGHTFLFTLNDDYVIDANVGGNAARWINHACSPNCIADEVDGRIFIKSLRTLKPGEELFYDYGLIIDDRYTPKLKKQYECRCGSKRCRGTMLAPKS